MIELLDVTRRFGAHTVIESLSHTFPERGIVALMGPSGSGKTTLLRLLAGLDRPNGGEVKNGYNRTAVAFQEPRLIPWLTCEENLRFVLQNENGAAEKAAALLRAVELEEVRNALPRALSGGMRQRVSLARALCVGADLLLLDEPFAGLDKELKSRLYPLIAGANLSGLTVIVTHDKSEAEALGAKILYLFGSPVTALRSEDDPPKSENA